MSYDKNGYNKDLTAFFWHFYKIKNNLPKYRLSCKQWVSGGKTRGPELLQPLTHQRLPFRIPPYPSRVSLIARVAVSRNKTLFGS